MEILFLNLLKISALCSLGILAILAVSPLLGKKRTVFWRYLLWIVLAIRLVIPLDFSVPGQKVVILVPDYFKTEELKNPSAYSGEIQDKMKEKESFGEGSPAGKDYAAGTKETGTEYIRADQAKEKGLQPDVPANAEHAGFKMSADFIFQAAAFLWAAGAAVLAVWQTVCCGLYLHRLKKTKVFLTKNVLPVYCSSAVFAPVLVGIRKPAIFLPCQEYDKEQLNFILEHELAHYRRKDLLAKLLLAFAGTIHWFNPFVIMMVRQAEKDIELLCDSRVVKDFTREEKKKYSETLLACAAANNSRRHLCTSEFSKDAKSLKKRFSNIFSGGKKKNGVLAAVFGIGILLFVSLFVVLGTSKGEDAGNDKASAVEENDTHRTKEDTALLEEKQSKLFGLPFKEAADAVYGAVFPKLLYASEDRAVLYDYWGLLIYNMKNQKIEQLLDLKAADLGHIQGEKVTHIEVSDDGEQILLYNEPNTTEQFIYNIEEKKLTYTDLYTFGENHFDGLFENGEKNYVLMESQKKAWLSSDSLWTEDGDIFHETELCGLSLVVGENTRGNAGIYPLFSEYYEKEGETAKAHLGWNDIRRLIGKEFLYTDAEGFHYYLEEDKDRESSLWEVGDALEPLLLTRYKGGERQILEDLIYQEAWKESPVLFAGGRIVYKAAKTADIAGVKESTLVSIAADGSDRKTADEILYRTFDGLCEEDGWIYYSGWTNDGTYPKPLCRIAPDFSGGPQFVEDIPGVLCGVEDGYVYYLAAEGKKAGIWKRNLETGEEVIYDKWGESAENMTIFYTGENGDSGIHVIFRYDYEDEIYDVGVRF